MARQIVKYESTEVAVEKTLAGLSELVRQYGGRRFEQIWDDTEARNAVAVRFSIDHPSLGELPVQLPARTVKIERVLLDGGKWRSYPKDKREQMVREQAHRIAWRHISDLTEQLLLAVRLDLRSLHEAFMADVEVYDRDRGTRRCVWRSFWRIAPTWAHRGLSLRLARVRLAPAPPAKLTGVRYRYRRVK